MKEIAGILLHNALNSLPGHGHAQNLILFHPK